MQKISNVFFMAAIVGANGFGLAAPLHAQTSPISAISGPLGASLAPLVDTVDATLDPVTNTLDTQLLEPVLGGLEPLTEPLLDTLEPVTEPLDGLVGDLTGGSLTDSLTNNDGNTSDGNGLVNDLLGGDVTTTGTETDEASLLPLVTEPVGESLAPLVDAVDTSLDPLTDTVDDQLLEPVLDGAAPLTKPLMDTLEPVTDPVDGTLADLTGGSLEDALVNGDDNTADGNGTVNDLLGGDSENADSGSEAGETSPLEPITAPLGESLAPLVDAVDTTLDPLTDAVDDQLLEPVLDALAPATEPLLDAVEPVTDPVDGLVGDLTGGSVEDALTNSDDNTADGNGAVNDILGGDSTAAGESDESSLIPLITEPVGETLDPLLSAVDQGLDPLTDVVDDQLLEPVLDGAAPLTEPLLDTLEPVTDPVDGTLAELTGGSVEDALTNNDDNTTDGNGLVNDLLGGGSENTDSGSEAGEQSPLQPITGPLGESVTPLVDAVDTALDPLTDAVDEAVEPVLGALEPVTEPVLQALEPVTDPVDGLISDLTGGSVEDALTTNDDNTTDGSGLLNDILGGRDGDNADAELSPLPAITDPVGEVLDQIVSPLDEGLDPLTDEVDGVVDLVFAGLEPVTEPVLEVLEPLTGPVDGTFADLTGGSAEDALTNNDDNTADGNGLVNDLLGGGDGSSGNGGGDGDDEIRNPGLWPNRGDGKNDLNPLDVVFVQTDAALYALTCEGADADGDGVCDEDDRCPNTPEGAAVLTSGCHLGGDEPLILNGVNFAYDSAQLTSASARELYHAVRVLKENPEMSVEIAGHTDDRGTDSYNNRLSLARADAVFQVLVNNGIEPQRLQVSGYGRNQPSAANAKADGTPDLAGMAQNRRVEFMVKSEEQVAQQ